MFKELDEIDAVTKADIRRVANETFIASSRTVGRIEFKPPTGAAAPPAAAGNGGAQ
jgi:predicted Zn-dependent peptidase